MDSQQSARSVAGKWAAGLVVVLGLLTLLGRLGGIHWAFDWVALGHHYYFAAGLLMLPFLLWRKHWGWVSMAAVVVLFNGWLLSPYLPTTPVAQSAPEETIRLLVYNMYYANEDLEGMVATIEGYEPDIVFIMEYSFDTQRTIESRFDQYQYRLIEPSRITMGLALFSHIPLESAVAHRFERTRIPIFEAQFMDEGRPFTLVAGHPWPPLPRWGGLHRAQMADITQIAAEAPQPLIVAGDFNASAWSYTVRELAQAADVQDARTGFWFRPTWRMNPLIQLPMDHVLVSEEWRVVNYEQGEPGGSDHDFLVLDLQLR